MTTEFARKLRDLARPAINLLPEYAFLEPIGRHKSIRSRTIDGFKFHLDVVDRGIGKALYEYGEREVAFMRLLRQEVQSGMVAVDIGANIGYTTVFLCAGVGSSGRVYAFEPDPHNVRQLTRNIRANGFRPITRVQQAAVSNAAGAATFYIADQPNVNSMVRSERTVRTIETPVITLSDYFQEVGEVPNFLKMDVEGHEVEVLDGAFELFRSTNETVKILLEVHPYAYSEDHDFSQQLRRYFEVGFNVKFVVSTPVPQPALFKRMGYSPALSIPTDGRVRGIYDTISNEDAIELACYPHEEATEQEVSKKIVRSLLIQKN